jgi:hypothetical protein
MVFDVCRITKCSSSGRHAVLWYFFLHSYNQPGRWQDVLDQAFIHEENVHFVGSYYIRVLQCTVQKTHNTPVFQYTVSQWHCSVITAHSAYVSHHKCHFDDVPSDAAWQNAAALPRDFPDHSLLFWVHRWLQNLCVTGNVNGNIQQ